MPDDARITRDRRAEGLVERLRALYGEPRSQLSGVCQYCEAGRDEPHDRLCVWDVTRVAADVLSAAQRLIQDWREHATQADRWAEESEARQDGANRHAFRKERRIWSTCADELAALLSDPIPSRDRD